jgi:hypothetical protein
MSAKKYWEENKVRGVELMAMRMMRKKSVVQMSRLLKKHKTINNYTPNMIEWIEKNVEDCPKDIVEVYMKTLGITRSHMAQFKNILKGESKEFVEDREIPTYVKDIVRKRCKRKCVHCGSKKNLHFHHIVHFSKGGQNTPSNLILLCASCHAEEHKGEKCYHMLLKKAEG